LRNSQEQINAIVGSNSQLMEEMQSAEDLLDDVSSSAASGE